MRKHVSGYNAGGEAVTRRTPLPGPVEETIKPEDGQEAGGTGDVEGPKRGGGSPAPRCPSSTLNLFGVRGRDRPLGGGPYAGAEELEPARNNIRAGAE